MPADLDDAAAWAEALQVRQQLFARVIPIAMDNLAVAQHRDQRRLRQEDAEWTGDHIHIRAALRDRGLRLRAYAQTQHPGVGSISGHPEGGGGAAQRAWSSWRGQPQGPPSSSTPTTCTSARCRPWEHGQRCSQGTTQAPQSAGGTGLSAEQAPGPAAGAPPASAEVAALAARLPGVRSTAVVQTVVNTSNGSYSPYVLALTAPGAPEAWHTREGPGAAAQAVMRQRHVTWWDAGTPRSEAL